MKYFFALVLVEFPVEQWKILNCIRHTLTDSCPPLVRCLPAETLSITRQELPVGFREYPAWPVVAVNSIS